jgi:hypothetical protein
MKTIANAQATVYETAMIVAVRPTVAAIYRVTQCNEPVVLTGPVPATNRMPR